MLFLCSGNVLLTVLSFMSSICSLYVSFYLFFWDRYWIWYWGTMTLCLDVLSWKLLSPFTAKRLFIIKLCRFFTSLLELLILAHYDFRLAREVNLRMMRPQSLVEHLIWPRRYLSDQTLTLSWILSSIMDSCKSCIWFWQTAQEAMTPIESTFSLDVNSKLDWWVCYSTVISFCCCFVQTLCLILLCV